MLAGNNRRRRNAARLIVGLLGVVVIGAVMVLAVPHSSPPQDLSDLPAACLVKGRYSSDFNACQSEC